ncbi:MAG: hypothetical protein L0K43_06030, partial [Bifidobacterium crudilactis]|nr:hypothetical protein [Bifidobacterium crudilactis]
YIPHHGFGAIQSIPVHPTSDAPTANVTTNLTTNLTTNDAARNAASDAPDTELGVTLRPQVDGTLGVFASSSDASASTASQTNTPLGSISPADRAEYPELDLILSAGLYPAATAKVEESGLVLRLPRPGLCLPANNPPSSQWVLLGHGPMQRVLDIQDDSGILPTGRAHLLVTLKAASKSKNTNQASGLKPELGIDVYLGNHFLAALGSAPSALLTTVHHNDEEGITTLAHAFHSPRHGHRELDIFAGQPTSAGAGPEWQLAHSAPRSDSASETFETSSFRVITDADLAALDKVVTPTPNSDNSQKAESKPATQPLGTIAGWGAIALGIAALILIAIIVV